MLKKQILISLSLGVVAAFALLVSVDSYAATMDVFLPSGQKVQGEVIGNKLMLKGGTLLAPDGKYKCVDGKSIIVHNGIIIEGGMVNQNKQNLKPAPLDKSKGIVGPQDSVELKWQWCYNDGDCLEGRQCANGRCNVIPNFCKDPSQCAAGEICKSNRCQACTCDMQCPAGKICKTGVCE
jgi:hypothetical protein